MTAGNDALDEGGTRLGAIAAAAAEHACLAAVVLTPLFFNLHTARIFEEDKVPLLRSLAVVIAGAGAVWVIEGGRTAVQALRRIWRLPVVAPAAALAGAQILATATSVAPGVSLWGGYTRCQGTYTWLSYGAVFVALLLFVRDRARIERAMTVVLLASLPVALYAVMQHFDLDPIGWGTGAGPSGRASSTAGNPIFLGAYLIMVIPLAAARIVRDIGRAARASRAVDALRHGLSIAASAVLLGLQVVALAYSESRGPLLGLGAGATIATLVVGIRRGARWLALSTAALAVCGILFLMLFNLPDTPLAPLRELPYIGRLGKIMAVGPGEGGGQVRLLVWEGAERLLAARPTRLLTGYGPETLLYVLAPYRVPELAHLAGYNAAPDRSHNTTFDALIHTGVVGAVGELAGFLFLVAHILRRLGALASPSQQRVFWATVVLGAAAGAMGPRLVDGSFRLAGVGLPAGLLAGILAYLIWRGAISTTRSAAAPGWGTAPLIGLLAAVSAHFVEIGVGFGTAATNLHYWTYAALAVAIGAAPAAPAPAAGIVADARATGGGRNALAPPSEWIAITPAAALILAALTFSFVPEPLALWRHGPAVLLLLSSAWVFGLLLVAAEAGTDGGRLARAGAYTGISLGVWLLYAAGHVWWLSAPPAGERVAVMQAASTRANAAVVFYGAVAIALAAAAYMSHLTQGSPRFAARGARRRSMLYPWLAVGAAFAIVETNLNLTRAGAFARRGDAAASGRRWDAAHRLYAEAQRLWPRADRYPSDAARALLELARSQPAAPPAERRRLLSAAAAAMARAVALNPLNTDNLRNLAAVHRTWAALSDDPAEQVRETERAESYYRRAVGANPRNAALHNEWARLYLERHDGARALERLDVSLQIDPRYDETHVLRGQVGIDAGALEAALADFERALKINPSSLAAWQGKSIALGRLGRIEDAVEAAQRAVAVAPDDANTHRNLALLYRDAGRAALALEEATVALALAGPDDREVIRTLVAALGGGNSGNGDRSVFAPAQLR